MHLKVILFSLSLIASLLFYLDDAEASFRLEPYLGYEVGSAEQVPKAGDTTFTEQKSELSGIGVGLRVLYQFTHANFGFDLNYASLQSKDKSTNETDAAARQSIFLVGGFDNGYVAFNLGYAPLDELTFSTNPKSVISGSAQKVGLSFLALRSVRINLEYVQHQRKEITTNNASIQYDDHLETSKYDHTALNFAFLF